MEKDFVKAQVVMLRGLGYTQTEISEKTEVSQSTVSYILREVNETARMEGDEPTFTSILASGYGPLIVKAMQQLFRGRM